MQISEKSSAMRMSNCFRRIAFIILMCMMGTFNSHAQMPTDLSGDSILRPDSNNVERIVNADNIKYVYYFDNRKAKVRSEHIYSIDKTDSREVIFIRYYCFSGKKSIERTYKNYNRKLKRIDPYFTISKRLLANQGKSADPYFGDSYFPYDVYTLTGAFLSWYCNGNRRDSCWLYTTDNYTKRSSGKYDKSGNIIWVVKNVTEYDGTIFTWYESGNLFEESIFRHGKSVKTTLYFDNPGKKIQSLYIHKENKYNKSVIVLTSHYYENDTLKGYVISNLNTGEETKRMEYYPNGKTKLVKITQPDFVVVDSYDSTGKPIKLKRKVLYQNEWYEYNEQYFPNGQLKELVKESVFFALHPEYGTMPDSITYYGVVYDDEGRLYEKDWNIVNGEYHSLTYRKDGSLLRKEVISTTGAGVVVEYDEQGNLLKERRYQLKSDQLQKRSKPGNFIKNKRHFRQKQK